MHNNLKECSTHIHTVGLEFFILFSISHVGHVHKLEISMEALIRKNFATLDGFATKCHVTSP